VARDLDVLVVGEINPDIVVSDPDPRPRFGQGERFVDGITLTIGSSSAIMACGAARLGLRVAMVGVVGDDAMGRFMLEALRERGVDTTACRTDPDLPTPASVILATPHDRAILTSVGTFGALRASDVPDALMARARHLHVGSWFVQEASGAALAGLAARACAAGLTVSVDPNGDPLDRWDGGFRAFAADANLVLPNAAEACRIARVDDPAEAARRLAIPGADGRGPVVAVKLGGDGALAATPSGELVRATAMAVDPVDTIGAGDSFDAGFLATWLDGLPLEDCLRFGVVCGSLSTLGVGGTEAQPTRDEVEAVLARSVA